ncbi:hypothetical protein I4U23_005794 [Adineta vaga]|nr:hypothetical protein I4U23_005794 [Adineta vaga]
MSTSNTIPPDYQNANPLLYTFRDYHTGIQPYFVFVTQFFIFEISLRLWDRAVYGTWLLPSDFIYFERVPITPNPTTVIPPPIGVSYMRRRVSRIRTIYLLQQKGILIKTDKDNEKMPTFDLFDLIFVCLPLFAHTIWYCIVQSNCSSGEFASTWNCYNLFGYRIYNYLFDPFSMFAFEFISKIIIIRDKKHHKIPLIIRKKKWRRILAQIIFYPSLILSTITFLFVGALILPYAITNIIPMIIIYSFIVMFYAYIITVYLMLIQFYTFITKKIFKFNQDKLSRLKTGIEKYHFKRRFVVRFAVRLSPYLVPVLFNLSQYFYYGEDFYRALTREANSRNINDYFQRVANSPQIAHTILSTI